jgi:hypothetical protein
MSWKDETMIKVTKGARADLKIVAAIKGQSLLELVDELAAKLKKQYVGRIQKNDEVANLSKQV